MNRRRFSSVWTVVVVAILTVAGCGVSTSAPPPATVSPAASTSALPPLPTLDPIFARATSGSLVTAQGRSFSADGRPFRFVGANVYDAAATDRYSCDPGARMDADRLRRTFALLHDQYGVSVIRFWAYQTYTDAGRDFSGVDAVIAAAKATGIRLLPVLEDGPGYCTTISPTTPKAAYESDTWFTGGYRKQFGTAVLSFRDYAKIVTQHYRNEPAILGWSMLNEADTSARDSQSRSALVDFAADMARVIKDSDPNHLLTVGTQSNGAAGASGADFLAVYRTPGIDFAEVHDWGYWGSDESPMPGGVGATPPDPSAPACQERHAKVGCSFAMSVGLNKPLVVGEAGIDRGDGSAPALLRRADLLKAKMDAAFAAGAAGYLIWRVTSKVTDRYDIVAGDQDPLLKVLATEAKKLGTPAA